MRLAGRVSIHQRLEHGGCRDYLRAKRRVGHVADLRDSQILPQSLVVHEEESLVLLDRAAEAGAELVQGERRNGRTVKGRPGIQRVVTQRVERAAVKLIGSGFGNHLHLHAARGTAFRAVHRGADAELGDRIERDVQSRFGLLRLFLHAIVIDAVKRIVRVVDGVAVKADIALRAVAVIHRARRQHHEAGPVSATHGNFLDLLGFDQAAHFRRTPVQGLQRRRDFHPLRNRAHHQVRVDGARLSHSQFDILKLGGLKAVPRDRDGVGADRHPGNLVRAGGAGGGLAAEAGRAGYRDHAGTLNHGLGGIRDGTVQRSVIYLG